MEESILISVKKLLGIAAEDTNFDTDIIIHINSVFSILYQLGVGNDSQFTIQDDSTEWGEFIKEGSNIEMVKTYMYLKVRMQFDQPMSTAVIESMNRLINEYEWRLNVAVES